jgi:hypothetical protein
MAYAIGERSPDSSVLSTKRMYDTIERSLPKIPAAKLP